MSDLPYGRVTNPERYAPLHGVADVLLERLARDYDVERTDDPAADEELSLRRALERLVRLTPSDPAAAPVTIGFTDFPGLLVRYGRWHTEAYPSCGCDACDEGELDLEQRLAADVEDLVSGRFAEEFSASGQRRFSFGDRTSGFWLDELPPPVDPPAVLDWKPWRRRADQIT
jgi:hypothetical protein